MTERLHELVGLAAMSELQSERDAMAPSRYAELVDDAEAYMFATIWLQIEMDEEDERPPRSAEQLVELAMEQLRGTFSEPSIQAIAGGEPAPSGLVPYPSLAPIPCSGSRHGTAVAPNRSLSSGKSG